LIFTRGIPTFGDENGSEAIGVFGVFPRIFSSRIGPTVFETFMGDNVITTMFAFDSVYNTHRQFTIETKCVYFTNCLENCYNFLGNQEKTRKLW